MGAALHSMPLWFALERDGTPMDATSLLLEIRNEQERQRLDLEAIKETLGVLGGREQLTRLAEEHRARRAYHDRRGLDVVRRYRAGNGKGRPEEEAQ
jgi:hypothetical protein